jgi:hypothetical protein
MGKLSVSYRGRDKLGHKRIIGRVTHGNHRGRDQSEEENNQAYRLVACLDLNMLWLVI